MQIVFHVGSEALNPAGVIAVGGLRHIFRAVGAPYGNHGPRHLLRHIGRLEGLRARQGEPILTGGTDVAFDNEQVGILCRDVGFIFLDTARQYNAQCTMHHA